jgi:hypothetical protein
MSAWMYGPNAIEIAHEKLRRGQLFQHVIRRRDLVSFESLADWYARENADRRKWAFKDLGNAARRGEFGPPGRPSVFYLPVADPPTYRPFWIRRTGSQIAYMRASNHDETPHLWAPYGLCVDWLNARQIHLPPWLSARQSIARPPVDPDVVEVQPTPGQPTLGKARSIDKAKWEDWLGQQLPETPTKRQAEKWADQHNYSISEVRGLHKTLSNKLGRRCKPKNGPQ